MKEFSLKRQHTVKILHSGKGEIMETIKRSVIVRDPRKRDTTGDFLDSKTILHDT